MHLGYLRLPYFWDEAQQFVPAARDILHSGSIIPISVAPNVHPPGVMLYMAAAWRLAGESPAVTRSAMLLLSVFGLLSAFLVSIELSKEVRGMPAFLTAALLGASPLFFAQSIMAQLDAPAMLFTMLALLLFLQERMILSAAACVVLVLVKETGLATPLVLSVWLAYERRWRDAGYFLAPVVVLASWLVALHGATGEWAGNRAFAQYNVLYPLHPVRLGVNLLRRIYYLAIADFRWLGVIAVFTVWRHGYLRTRAWRVVGCLLAAHVLEFTIFGGAVLERYLLPVMPLVFAAMAAALGMFKRPQRIAATVVLLAGTMAGNVLNPPYPFPYDNNLAYTDFLRLGADAADYLAHWYPHARVDTAWPLTMELEKPELGFVRRPIAVHAMGGMTSEALDRADWKNVQVMVIYSRGWDPEFNLMRFPLVQRFWGRFYGFTPAVTEAEARDRVPFPIETRIARRGQWLDIFVNPEVRRTPPEQSPAQVATGFADRGLPGER
jgi:hypothetical protein